MNKLTKLLFSVISSVAIATSAFAGELTVTGSAKATYTILSNTGTAGTHGLGKGLGIANEFSLGASGELDNGMTWTYAQDIDGATVQDDASMSLGTDFGTFKVCISECPLSTKYAFDNSAYGVGSDTGYGGGSGSTVTMQYGANINSYNNVQYHAPADLLPLGMTFKYAITPGGASGTANDSVHSVSDTKATPGDMTQMAATITPIDGLTISASYYDFDELGTKNSKQTAEGGSLAGNYSYGNLSIGYGQTRHVPNLRTGQSNTAAHVKGYENEAYSIGWAVNDNLSVSYTNEESTRVKAFDNVTAERQDSNTTMEIDTIDLSYTMGGMTIGLSQSETSLDSYTAGDEVTETIVAVSMAF
jgi:hypothetical protein